MTESSAHLQLRANRESLRLAEQMLGGVFGGTIIRHFIRPALRRALNPPHYFDPEQLARF